MMASVRDKPCCSWRDSPVWAALSLAIIFANAQMLAAAERLPTNVVAALERNTNALQTITVKWTVERNTDRPLEQALRILHPTDWKRKLTAGDWVRTEDCRYTWQDGKIYSYWNRKGRKSRRKKGVALATEEEWSGWVQELSFDGDKYYNADGLIELEKGKTPQLTTVFVKDRIQEHPHRTLIYADYFAEIGIRFPQTGEEMTARNAQPISEVLYLLRQGAQLVTVSPAHVDDVNTLQVDLMGTAELAKNLIHSGGYRITSRVDSIFRFHLDPSHGYSVRQYDVIDGESGKLTFRAKCSDFTQLPGRDVWLPRECLVSYYTVIWIDDIYQDPLYFNRYRLLECETGDSTPNDTFVVNYNHAAGSEIWDYTMEGAEGVKVHYRVPANPTELDAVIAAAKERAGGKEPSSRGMWIVLINAVLIVSLVFFALWRRRSS